MTSSRTLLGIALGSLVACAPRGAVPDPGAGLPPVTFEPVALRCAPSLLPASFIEEQRAQPDNTALERRAPLFEETRATVVTTLSLLLGTGRWAGSSVSLGQGAGPRDGTGVECQALFRALRGPAQITRLNLATLPRATALAGIVDYEYLPTPAPQRVVVRMLNALIYEGRVLRWERVEVSTPYVEGGPDYQERNATEITQDLTQQLAQRSTR